MKRYFVFDCDGTLISSHHNLLNQVREHFMSFGMSFNLEQLGQAMHLNPRQWCLNLRVDPDLHEKALSHIWVSLNSNRLAKYSLFSGLKSILLKLRRSKHGVYVWTGRARASTIEILNHLDIMSIFEDLRCAGDGMNKPAPQGMIEMLGNFNKNEIVLIGDSVNDALGAQNFGCEFWGVTWAMTSTVAELKEAGATHVFESTEEFLQFLEEAKYV